VADPPARVGDRFRHCGAGHPPGDDDSAGCRIHLNRHHAGYVPQPRRDKSDHVPTGDVRH